MSLLTIPDLSERRVEAELMDSSALDRTRHLDALDALARVNAVSFAAVRVWTEVERMAAEHGDPVRVLDIACGGGDIMLSVARRAAEAGIAVDLLGCDVSEVALDRARSTGGDALGVRFVPVDVLAEPIPAGFDVVCSSLFLHHLPRATAADLLRSMAAAAKRVLLVQDLLRTRLGYVFARVGLGVLTRSDVARHDGPVSVAASLTLSEVEQLSRDAGLEGATVRACWPQRFVLRWKRS